jgi:glycyl-tRNA synthetase beta chain
MKDKVERVKKIASSISPAIPANPVDLAQAADLCKADLATNMVMEFSSLEGIMGRLYAEAEGMKKEISQALSEYYKPRYSTDSLPEGNIGIILALADKIDSLYGLFSIGLKPKGKSDPYGMRRIGIALMRILWEKELNLSLDSLIESAQKKHTHKTDIPVLYTFLLSRLEQYLMDTYQKANKLDTNSIRAVIYNSDSLIQNKKTTIQAIVKEKNTKEFTQFIELTKRICNIAIKGKTRTEHKLDVSQLNESESAFYSKIQNIVKKESCTLQDVMSLTVPGTAFFDENMIMSENPEERSQRLEILWMAYDQISRIIKPEYILS